MSEIDEVTREGWIMSTFPEWGTWLNEDIENCTVPEGNVKLWWLGCTGMWVKTPGGANITIDLWTGNGKRTHGNGLMKVGHQMANMADFHFPAYLSLAELKELLEAVPFQTAEKSDILDPSA